MIAFPQDLDEAIVQARTATQAALEAGYVRLQVEILIPELKLQPIAEQFIQDFAHLGSHLRVFFPDPGAAALARRDWGNPPYAVRGIRDLNAQIQPEDSLFIFVEPSAVEAEDVEKLCDQASPRPVLLLNPVLDDLMNVGVGYTSRKRQERFVKTIEPCYYLKPLAQGTLFRCYPHPWQLWLTTEEGDPEPEADSPDSWVQNRQPQKLAEFPHKPDGETLDRTLAELFAPQERTLSASSHPSFNPSSQQTGTWLEGLQRVFRWREK